MGKNNNRIFTQFTVLVIVLTATILVKEAASIRICNIDTNDLEKCRSTVTGRHPTPPGRDCCAVAKAANLECLCPYKPYLSKFGVDTSKIRPVLAKCGVKSPSCI